MTTNFGTRRLWPNSFHHQELSLWGDRKLKIWVPHPVFEALTLVAGERDTSRPELIRRILFAHLFGRHALEEVLGSWDQPTLGGRPLFSQPNRGSDEPKLPLGKSIADALVLVSSDIHDGLRVLASRHRQPLGTYAAYVLCWAMFGRGVYARLALRVTQGMWLGDDHDEPGSGEVTS